MKLTNISPLVSFIRASRNPPRATSATLEPTVQPAGVYFVQVLGQTAKVAVAR